MARDPIDGGPRCTVCGERLTVRGDGRILSTRHHACAIREAMAKKRAKGLLPPVTERERRRRLLASSRYGARRRWIAQFAPFGIYQPGSALLLDLAVRAQAAGHYSGRTSIACVADRLRAHMNQIEDREFLSQNH